MVVLVLSACPAGLRGHLTRWLLEISPGVFVGILTTRVRDLAWQRVVELSKDGRAIMIYSTRSEQRLAFKVHPTNGNQSTSTASTSSGAHTPASTNPADHAQAGAKPADTEKPPANGRHREQQKLNENHQVRVQTSTSTSLLPAHAGMSPNPTSSG